MKNSHSHAMSSRVTRLDAVRLTARVGLVAVGGFALALPVGIAAQDVLELPVVDRPLDTDLEDVYRIDAELPGLSAPLATVAGLAFDDEGNIYVYDRGFSPVTARIVMVDAGGSLVREFGKMGWERGEFRGPGNFALLPGGRAVVSDSEHSGYLLFGATGEYERMVRFPRQAAGGMMSMIAGAGTMPDLQALEGGRAGDFIYRTNAGEMDMALDEANFSIEISAQGATGVIERVSLEGNRISVDTVVRAWRPAEGIASRWAMSANPNAMAGDDPDALLSLGDVEMAWAFDPPFDYGVLPDGGLAYVDTVTYQVKIAGPEGDVLRVITRSLDPDPVTEELKAEVLAASRDAFETADEALQAVEEAEMVGLTQGMISDMVDEVLASMGFFPEVPVIAGLRVTWEGGIWVTRTGDPLNAIKSDEASIVADLPVSNMLGSTDIPLPSGASGPIDVISADGSYVGTFGAGALEVPRAFGPDGLAAWVESVDDQQVVVVRRLPTAVRMP